MTKLLLKTSRLKLDSTSYAALRWKVLERDNWRCQACGGMRDLEVHHLQFRSHSGPDIEQNLMTLCATCHQECHKRGKMGFKA
jgi:5-methylcytosine-specific restriction endonuclease McrA